MTALPETGREIPALPSGRKLQQYAGCLPEAVAGGSVAQMQHFVRDAKQDIAFLAARLASLEAERAKTVDTLREENEALRQVAHDLTNALIQVRPTGGSELFKRFDDKTYFAEPAYCAAAINGLRDEVRMFKKEKARRALASEKGGQDDG